MMITDNNNNEENENGETLPFSFKKDEVLPAQIKSHWEKIAAELAKNEHNHSEDGKGANPPQETGRDK